MNQVVEERKSHSVGGGEENSVKNRSDLVIPYDRNRVILTPVPAREHSTYINASFIEVKCSIKIIYSCQLIYFCILSQPRCYWLGTTLDFITTCINIIHYPNL